MIKESTEITEKFRFKHLGFEFNLGLEFRV
jgi:hypothetical protein